MSIFPLDAIRSYPWKELDGKTLTITVGYDGPWFIVVGTDTDGTFYVLHEGLAEKARDGGKAAAS